MQRVQGYEGIQGAAAEYDDGARAMARLRFGPDPVEVIQLELDLIEAAACSAGLLISTITDPENTPEAYGVIVLLNGTARQLREFGVAMAVRAR